MNCGLRKSTAPNMRDQPFLGLRHDFRNGSQDACKEFNRKRCANFSHNLSPIACWIRNACFFEAAAPQDAGIAGAARQSFRRRIVAAVREGKIHTGVDAGLDDLSLAHMQKRRMDPVRCRPFDSGFGRQVGKVLKCLQEFRSAVRVPGIVDWR